MQSASRSWPNEGSSVTRVYFQVKLNPVAHAIVLKRQLIFKRSLALPLEQDLVRLASDAGGNHDFELANLVRGEAWDGCLGAETVVDVNDNHLLAGSGGCRGCRGRGCRGRRRRPAAAVLVPPLIVYAVVTAVSPLMVAVSVSIPVPTSTRRPVPVAALQSSATTIIFLA
ncbi:hypothetical protein PpBr36_07153 [Pyricularia pennisetigena]|uniref:hypothetical protein n=1 Tax=Pyricularia pennisetigena TaxID=1578925 RepID=UPI001152CD4A|nr:hypothetical protein PpBr36_07153 [Pyricularia pennisetigena]TLS25473.1 hypothetical protein PpBr36_07153 [Pyricularia pennisetigena]